MTRKMLMNKLRCHILCNNKKLFKFLKISTFLLKSIDSFSLHLIITNKCQLICLKINDFYIFLTQMASPEIVINK